MLGYRLKGIKKVQTKEKKKFKTLQNLGAMTPSDKMCMSFHKLSRKSSCDCVDITLDKITKDHV